MGLAGRGIRHVLLDIEGTTTPLAFVHDVLFPYARQNLQGWLRDTDGTKERLDVQRALAREHERLLAEGEDVPAWSEASADAADRSIVAFVEWLMDRDWKSPALKELQGFIWERGYQNGELHGVVFPDVPGAMRRWRDEGVEIAIYSSGSELAQRRLFASTPAGDLTPLVTAFFDTRVGAKRDPASYRRIAESLGKPPAAVLFVSDVSDELDAARAAGLATALAARPGNRPVASGGPHAAIRTFNDL